MTILKAELVALRNRLLKRSPVRLALLALFLVVAAVVLGGGAFTIVAVAKDCASLKSKLLEEAPSPMTYNSPKPQALLEEDKTVSTWKIGLKPDGVRMVDAEKVFE